MSNLSNELIKVVVISISDPAFLKIFLKINHQIKSEVVYG